MEYLILICGCLGAWLLVAGPVYQAALELREEEFDRDMFREASSAVAPREAMSPWWWLLPPVAYLLQRRRSTVYRRAVMEALGSEQREQTVSFMNKASAWLTVASGAFLIAVKETWELAEHLEWPLAVFWVVVVAVAILCLMSAALRVMRSARILARDEADAARRRGRPERG